MAIVIVCSVLLLIGLAATFRWGSLDVRTPDLPRTEQPPPPSLIVHHYVWHLSLVLWTTLITAFFIIGPAGRLVMRLLAATAGDAAQGRKTEATEVVGDISVGGTISLFLFAGLLAGFLSVLVFMVVRRWLPRGRVGGLLLGTMLLVVFGTKMEPLRADNVDFDLVGPGWLSIATFSAMALVQGMAIFAVAGRVSRALPLPGASMRTIAPHAILVMLVPGFFLVPLVVLLGGAIVLLSRKDVGRLWRSRQVAIAGRLVLAAVTLIALPGFVSAISSIAGRGP